MGRAELSVGRYLNSHSEKMKSVFKKERKEFSGFVLVIIMWIFKVKLDIAKMSSTYLGKCRLVG